MAIANSIDVSAAITTEELKKVLESLKSQRETILSVYNNEIGSVLASSTSCFAIAGLDYSRIHAAYDETFKSLTEKFDLLINILENDVIRNYSELAIAIKQMFTVDFARKMEELLGIS